MLQSIRRQVASAGFTLIELLMVVAIIAVLAAIAIPNMLEAQVRAKVSRAMSDLRSVGVGLEAYRVDNSNYPPENWNGPELISAWGGQFIPNATRLVRITTPTAYLTALPWDVFDPGTDPLNQLKPHTYHYVCINDPRAPQESSFFRGQNDEHITFAWMLQSYGPDCGSDSGFSGTYWQFPRYDPSNGTVSIGNILRTGP
jgi:type II secretion system protein G